MSALKHTPGPWTATQWDDVRNGSNGFDVGGHPDYNARLIAAAPELLKALESICSVAVNAEPDDPNRIEQVYQIARAAIAKATGGAA